MAEIPFEYLLAALEVAAGTPVDPPTRHLNLLGTISPMRARYRPEEARGTLAQYYRSQTVRQWSEFSGEGGLDVYTLPLLLNTIVKGGVDGSGGTKSALTTVLAGDNNDMVFTAVMAGVAGDSITIEYDDPSGNDVTLLVTVTALAIKVRLATGPAGAITSTAAEVKAAIDAHTTANLMVTVANAPANSGAGVVTEMAATPLAGGANGTVYLPVGAIKSRLWDFVPTMTANDLKTLTLYWGDPNVQAFQAAYCQLDELTIKGDASGTDGVTLSVSGQGWFPTKTAPASTPAMLQAPFLMPSAMQVWIDTTSAIGTTPITGRVVSAEAKIPLEGPRKWLAAGPGVDLNFGAVGRGKRHAEATLVFEVPDMVQYDQWDAGTSLKVRIRFNGPAIETVGAATFYHYVDVDIYGPFDGLTWGEHEGTNRTAELTILSEYNVAAAHDWAMRVQSDLATL
jgi:hypothetical protein